MNYVVFFLLKQEWLECLSKIRCNKYERNTYECISQCQQALSSTLGLKGGIMLLVSHSNSILEEVINYITNFLINVVNELEVGCYVVNELEIF